MTTIRIVTRGSALALAQTDIAVRALRKAVPGITVSVVTATTAGDRDRLTPLSALSERGLFVGGLRAEILGNRADVAVHSLKDVPTQPISGLALGAVLERGEARDVFAGHNGARLSDLQPGARVGTSSSRREAMVRAARPGVEVVPLRGNVDTRLRRVAEGTIDGAILAGVGLVRLGRTAEITEWLAVEHFLPAPGQGALALECRADDETLLAILARVDHAPTRAAVVAERAFLAVQGRNCTLPVGAYATVTGDRLRLRATLAGDPEAADETEGPRSAAEALGEALGRTMRERHEGGRR